MRSPFKPAWLLLVGCVVAPPVSAPVESAPVVRVEERRHVPSSAGQLDTGTKDHLGRPLGIACMTCHGTDHAPGLAQGIDAGRAAHAGLELAHGTLDCMACHDAANPGRLHLADGTPLTFAGAMQLCAQCHGPQFRDYSHGAHGGMTGYWDAARGPRDRNTCLACHAAHAPKYPQVIPAPPPRDRGREGQGAHP